MVLTGDRIKRLMRKHGHTIRSLGQKFQLTQKRVREVRTSGVRDFLAQEWFFMLTGRWPDEAIPTATTHESKSTQR